MTIQEIANSLTVEKMVRYGFKESIAKQYVDEIPSVFYDYSIDTKERISHFFGQTVVESAYWSKLEEGTNYSIENLMSTFPKRVTSVEQAKSLITDKKKLFDFLYGGRNGNSQTEGYLYRGRGIIQVTFKSNYQLVKTMLNIDCVANPDLLLVPEYALKSACVFWRDKKLVLHTNVIDNFKVVTKIVNGDEKRKLSERTEATKRAYKIFFQ